jgi:hypothetical protein
MQDALLQQAATHATLTHRSVQHFYGVCLDPPLLILQNCPRGSLIQVLEQQRLSALMSGGRSQVCTEQRLD